jgi:hypothetical protein
MNERVSSFRTKIVFSFPEAFLVFDVKKKSKAQARALSFPAYDRAREESAIAPQVGEVVWLRTRAASILRERTRAFDLFHSATSKKPNQPLQPTRLHGAVFLTRLLRSTSTCCSKSFVRSPARG